MMIMRLTAGDLRESKGVLLKGGLHFYVSPLINVRPLAYFQAYQTHL